MPAGIVNLEKFKTGDADFALKIAKLGYQDTPLFSMINKVVPSRKARSWEGHKWRYETVPEAADNKYGEASAPAPAQIADVGESLNHYQIFKNTYGISGSMEDKRNTEDEDELIHQGALALVGHRKAIEKALFSSEHPQGRTTANQNTGTMGGLFHWVVANNKVDANKKPLDLGLLRSMLKPAYFNGQTITHIFVSDVQKDKIDDLLESKIKTGLGAKVLETTSYTEIKNLAYSPNVKIVLTPYVAKDVVLGVSMPNVFLVYQRLTKKYDLARTQDMVTKEIITEATLRVNNPYAVAAIDNLAV